MKTNNYNYSGWKLNGFLALVLNLAIVAGSVWLFVELFKHDDFCALLFVGSVVLLIAAIIMACGYLMLEPNEARVLLFFGNYRGTFYDTGFWWINPFMSAKKLSMRARNLNVDPIKVNDKAGNPILIGLVLVWKIKTDGAYKAVFEIDAPVDAGTLTTSSTTRMNILENFVAVQSDSALRQVAGMYAYDENSNNTDGEITLRSGGDEINDRLTDELNRLATGVGADEITLPTMIELENCVADSALVNTVMKSIYEVLGEFDSGELKVSGLDRLLQYPEFADAQSLGELLGALERKDDILDLVSDVEGDGVNVVIGSESSVRVINNSTLVFKPIKRGGRTVGAVGVIGPLRMDYGRVLAMLDSLGGNITHLLNEPNTPVEGE